jgi:hypothetical protein
MTVKTSYAPAVLVADGTADEIALPWQFFEPSDIAVTLTKNGVPTPLLLSRDYAVIGGKDGNGIPQIGMVKLRWVPEDGTEVKAERITPKVQLENYDRRFEAALDRVMLITQEAVQTVVERVVVQEVRTVREIAVPAEPTGAPVLASLPDAPDLAPLKTSILEHERAFQGVLQIIEDLRAREVDLRTTVEAMGRRIVVLEKVIIDVADAAQQKLSAA